MAAAVHVWAVITCCIYRHRVFELLTLVHALGTLGACSLLCSCGVACAGCARQCASLDAPSGCGEAVMLRTAALMSAGQLTLPAAVWPRCAAAGRLFAAITLPVVCATRDGLPLRRAIGRQCIGHAVRVCRFPPAGAVQTLGYAPRWNDRLDSTARRAKKPTLSAARWPRTRRAHCPRGCSCRPAAWTAWSRCRRAPRRSRRPPSPPTPAA